MPSSSSRLGSALFRCKALALQARRAYYDRCEGIRAHAVCKVPLEWKEICEVRSPLWNDAGEVDPELERGKVQNLRVAVKRLDRIHVEADSVFSFWAQVGRATKRRGFVAGRLLREGCLMPAVGGGLCQLSNALYDLALQAGFEVLERHAHSRVVAGSAATIGRDATVAWNYVDLRFRSAKPYALRARLTPNELVVSLWGEAVATQEEKQRKTASAPLVLFETRPILQALAHSCATCGDEGCFRYDARPRRREGRTAWILDEAWPEWSELVKGRDGGEQDILMAARLALWPSDGWHRVEGLPLRAWQRSIATRWASRSGAGGAVWKTQLESCEHIAGALEGRLSSEVTHVVVAQSLLPFLWQMGALGGRTFDVLLTRTPFDELSVRLDEAFRLLGDTTLSDFRPPLKLMGAEREAMNAARILYSPHRQLSQSFGGRGKSLEWTMPQAQRKGLGDALIFASSSLARKGAYAVRDAAHELSLPVIITGRDWMGTEFWDGVEVQKLGENESWLGRARVAVLPAAVEHAPRNLLRALSGGIPVIATAECGLGEREGVITIPFGDSEALVKALRVFF